MKILLVVGLADTNSGDPDPLAALGIRVFLSLLAALLGPLLRRCAPCPSNPHWGLSGACWRRLSSALLPHGRRQDHTSFQSVSAK